MTPEVLVAILSLAKIIGTEKFKVLKSEIGVALKLGEEIDRLVAKVLDGEPIDLGKPIPLSAAKEIKEAVISLNIATILEDIMPRLEDEGLGLEVGSKISDVLAYLQEVVPPVDGVSLLNKFIWRCRIVDNPLWLIKILGDLQLTGIEVETLETVYPEIYNAIIQSFVTQITEKYDDIQEVPRNIRLMLAGLMRVPALDQKTLMAYSESEKPAQGANINTIKGA